MEQIQLFGNKLHSFIHSVFCLTAGPKPPPKRCLHIVASSFKWEYPVLSLRSSSSFLRLLPRLLATSISPFILPLITCFRRQFLRKMWPIQLTFRFLISCSAECTVENSWWWAEKMPETCGILWQNKIWIIIASGWLFKKKSVTMRGNMKVKYVRSSFLCSVCTVAARDWMVLFSLRKWVALRQNVSFLLVSGRGISCAEGIWF